MISFLSLIVSVLIKVSKASFTAALCVFALDFELMSLYFALNESLHLSVPIRSICPLAMDLGSLPDSKSSNFSEDEPQLRVKIFIGREDLS